MIIADTSGLLALFNAAEPDHADIVDRYHDQCIGLTDASLVVLAERFRTRRLLTLDRRHFAVVRPLSGGAFELLP